MSTRSATIVRQTTFWGETASTAEVMRFYRHTDGYPDGHGLYMANAVIKADEASERPEMWLKDVLTNLIPDAPVEFEPRGAEHGDIEYLYALDGMVDLRWGRRKDGTLPVTITVWESGWDQHYEDVMSRDPLFTGTAYEYVKWCKEVES